MREWRVLMPHDNAAPRAVTAVRRFRGDRLPSPNRDRTSFGTLRDRLVFVAQFETHNAMLHALAILGVVDYARGDAG